MTTRFALASIIKHPVSSPASHPILDKICKFEIGSLNPSERRQLNRERDRLLKKSE